MMVCKKPLDLKGGEPQLHILGLFLSSRRQTSVTVRPDLHETFHSLLDDGHNRVFQGSVGGAIAELSLRRSGQQAGIVRFGLAVDAPRIIYVFLSGGRIQKMSARKDGDKEIWCKLRFKAHEADELLSMLRAHSARNVTRDAFGLSA